MWITPFQKSHIVSIKPHLKRDIWDCDGSCLTDDFYDWSWSNTHADTRVCTHAHTHVSVCVCTRTDAHEQTHTQPSAGVTTSSLRGIIKSSQTVTRSLWFHSVQLTRLSTRFMGKCWHHGQCSLHNINRKPNYKTRWEAQISSQMNVRQLYFL
jgi:hypothetical protein